MKKTIGLLMSFIVFFTFSIPTFAASNGQSPIDIQQDQTIVHLSEDSYMEIVSSLNGDTHTQNNDKTFLIREYQYNELIHTVQGSFGGEKLICIDYKNGQEVNREIINVADRVTVSKSNLERPVLKASYGSVLEHIIYNKDIGNNTPGEDITVYSKITNRDSEAYTINGAVTDTISNIAGLILSVLSAAIPTTSVATTIAIAIVSYFGGNVAGGQIGVAFTEDVSVDATYYTLTGYHASSKYYTPGYKGVKRLVKTKKSNAYNKWFYEGYTPSNWKKGDDLASVLWSAVFGRPFPYVYAYR